MKNLPKIKTKKLKQAIFLGFLAFGLLTVAKVKAQEQIRTFTITPPTVEQNLNPGQNAEGVMKVINDSPSPLSFTVITQDFIVEDTKGTPELLPPNTLNKKYSAAAWVGVSPNSFTIERGKQQILNYYIQVPADARPGGHYTAVVFKPDSPIKIAGSGAAVNTVLGTLFEIGVNGDIKESAKVVRFSGNSFLEYGPANIFTQIINLGDLHIKPKGTITLSNMLGMKVSETKIKEANIFPGAARDLNTSVGSKVMIGRYKATLLASYGKNNNLPLAATFYFWVFPWKVAIIVVLVIIAAILGYMYWKRSKEKKPEENHEEHPQI